MDSGLDSGKGFLALDVVFAVFGFELVEPSGADVERFCLEDKTEYKGDRAEKHIHPVYPHEPHGGNDVTACDAADERA